MVQSLRAMLFLLVFYLFLVMLLKKSSPSYNLIFGKRGTEVENGFDAIVDNIIEMEN